MTALVVATGLVLTACGAESPPSSQPSRPHGYVEGAEEAAEAQSRLVVTGTGGQVRVVDLITEKVTSLDDVRGGGDVASLSTDGRFAYVATGGTTHVVDSGAWMVDHGDHVHYYRARIAGAGTVDGGTVAAHTDPAVATLERENGSTVVLEKSSLEDGEPRVTREVDGLAVPYEQRLVVADGDGVSVRDRKGSSAEDLDTRCADPAGTALTRRGAVIGCADGAVLVSEDDGRFTGEKIAYPREVADGERAREFTLRPGSSTLAAVAGDEGAWTLDTSERRWTFVGTPSAVAVNTAGEGTPLLALTPDGILHAYDIASGKETSSRKLLDSGVGDGADVSISVDTSRAYVNDPAAKRIHEIDYNDDLRVARTFDLDVAPERMVETGR